MTACEGLQGPPVPKPVMFYYGPWEQPGHFLFDEAGFKVGHNPIPWGYSIDGVLQPGCYLDRCRWEHRGPQNEGEALLHHKDGWTALCFWDRSVDERMGCNSNYFAKGIFTFQEMILMASTWFAKRWNVMKFQVKLVKDVSGQGE